MPATRKVVYLTFDDGPHPEATPFVLEQLAAAKAKGTFFCIGKNVQQYPAIFTAIQSAGHAIGNHTMHHVNGFKTAANAYVNDIAAAGTLTSAKFFRPPYGRITRRQHRLLQQQFPHIQTVMWSVLSGDFDVNISGETCLKNVLRHIEAGAIIVFHDSTKALPRLRIALPALLTWLQQNGYSCEVLPHYTKK